RFSRDWSSDVCSSDLRWAAGRDGRAARQLRANLRVVTGGALDEPALEALTTRALVSYARYWQEAFRLPALSTARILRDTTAPGLDRKSTRLNSSHVKI